MSKILEKIIKESEYKLTQFQSSSIDAIEQNIIKKNDKIYIKCLVRDKEVRLTPEEIVRQLYLYKLIHEYGYPIERMELERAITFGREKKRADIVIFHKNNPTSEEIIVELKKPKLKDGKEQLKSYCNATGAIIGVWTNGEQISYYHRKDPNFFEDIPDIPKENQKLKDILTERWTIDDLVAKDKLVSEKKSLKGLIEEMEDEVSLQMRELMYLKKYSN